MIPFQASTAPAPEAIDRTRPHAVRLRRGLAAMLAALLLAGCWHGSARGIALERLSIADPAGPTIDAMLFLPSDEVTGLTAVGPYDVRGSFDAAPKEGPFPLVVISHGTGGGLLGHHGLASYLAMHGFAAATLTHPGDNFADASGLGRASTFHRRAEQVSLVVDAVLADQRRLVDPDRVGVVGYSAGTVTALMLAGAAPDFTRLRAYCEPRVREGVCEDGGIVEEDRVDPSAPGDARVRAALLLAPVGAVFPRESLADIRLPVGIVAAGADELLPSAAFLDHLVQELPQLLSLDTVPGAGHFVFLAPCSPRLAAQAPSICKDPPGVDRETTHALTNGSAASFFRHALDGPAPGPRSTSVTEN